VGGYGKSVFVPYRLSVPEKGDAHHTAAVQTPWGEGDISAGFSISGWSEKAGFNFSGDIAYGSKQQAGNAYSLKAGASWVWIKPIDQVKLTLGVPYDDSMMGKVGSSDFVHYVLNDNYDRHDNRFEYGDAAYNIFTRINPYPWGNAAVGKNTFWPTIGAAAMLNIEPIDNLSIIVYVAPEMFRATGTPGTYVAGVYYVETEGLNGGRLEEKGIDQDYWDIKQIYKNMQVQVGYKIPGIGFARAQYIGVRNVIEAAFQLTALGDLMFDLGVKIPWEGNFRKSDPANYRLMRDYQVSLGATYKLDDLNVTARIDTAFGGYTKTTTGKTGVKETENGFDMIVYLIPSYNLDFATVGLDVGFEYQAERKDSGKTVDNSGGVKAGTGVWLEQKFGPGTLKYGVVVRFPTEFADRTIGSNTKKMATEFFIPIRVQVGF
jgi:hypothetical protein